MWPFSSAYPEVRVSEIQDEYDYIIVGKRSKPYNQKNIQVNVASSFSGGGTAGCVLANRLSAIPNTTVLLVERGPLGDTWGSRVPLLSSDFASNGSRTQLRTSEHQAETGQTYELLNGSALGGSSRINQMIYTRGLRAEYDMWKASGCPGWGWNEVKGSFLKSERCLDAGADLDVHGTLGMCLSAFFVLFRFTKGFLR
jgi:choline dehydrogenase